MPGTLQTRGALHILAGTPIPYAESTDWFQPCTRVTMFPPGPGPITFPNPPRHPTLPLKPARRTGPDR